MPAQPVSGFVYADNRAIPVSLRQGGRTHAGAAERVKYQWRVALGEDVATVIEGLQCMRGRGAAMGAGEMFAYQGAETGMAELLIAGDGLGNSSVG